MSRTPRSAAAVSARLCSVALLLCCCANDAGPRPFGTAAAQAAPETQAATGAPTHGGQHGGGERAPAAAPLPWGTSARWERDAHRPGQHLCFEVLGDRFQLSVWPERTRNPALVRGRYEVVPVRGGGQATRELRLHVETVTTKSLSRCRRSWVDTNLAFAEALGARFTVGGTVQVHATLVAPDRLRLCRGRACGEMQAVRSRDLVD